MLIPSFGLKKVLLFFSILLLFGCSKPSGEPPAYRIYLRGSDVHQEKIIPVSDLSSGFLNTDLYAVRPDSDIYFDLYYHQEFYYNLDRPDRIRKYRLNGNKLHILDSLVIRNMSEIETHSFVNDTTLLIIGLDTLHRNPVYALIDQPNFTVRAEGTLPIPDDGNYQRTSIGFALVRNDILYIDYVYHLVQDSFIATRPSMHLITLDFPQMILRNVSTDPRSTYELINGRHQPTMATDEAGDIYFVTNTSEAFGNIKEVPSGILKINAEKEAFDPAFFINLSDSLENCYPVAIWQAAENLFLVKCERNDLIDGWKDYLNKRMYEYYAIDMKSGEIQKLAIPLDAAWYANNVIVDKGLVYIAAKSEEGYAFQIFNPADRSIRKGLQLDASVDIIYSIDHQQTFN